MQQLTVLCPCPKLKCPRHGDCGPCREYHRNRKHPRPPRCERKPNWFRRLFGAARTR
ncbi:MAG: hypothetical protein WCE75_15545 [Terracidiphilus sp.]